MAHVCRVRIIATLLITFDVTQIALAQFTLQGPGVNPSDFRVTTFATGLNFPVGMTELTDGSLLVAISNGGAFSTTTSGSLVRLVDTDGNGVADVQQTLVSNVAGGRLTSVRRAGDFIAVTGQGQSTPISFYRVGASPSDPLAYLGQLNLTYPGGSWSHTHTSLLLRESPGQADKYELYFQLGSEANFAETTRTVSLGGTLGFSATLAGDAIHRVKISDNGSSLTATEHTQIATGLRNASGLMFHPQTDDFYIGENGIDGLVNINEPHSADELNVIPADQLGDSIADFGFRDTYEEYRTGTTIGSSGILPIVTFQPIPMPNGSESEGINEIAFAPPSFPAALRGGLFAGFHGRFNLGGVQNEENPVAFINLETGAYFHIIGNQETSVGHPDGFVSTNDTVYISDMSPTGALGAAQAGTGQIYAIRSLKLDGDHNEDGVVDAADYVVWRKNDGLPTGYDTWRANFGEPAGGSGSAGALPAQNAVPEPATMALLMFAAASWCIRRGRAA